jgi:hypothetical protein
VFLGCYPVGNQGGSDYLFVIRVKACALAKFSDSLEADVISIGEDYFNRPHTYTDLILVSNLHSLP